MGCDLFTVAARRDRLPASRWELLLGVCVSSYLVGSKASLGDSMLNVLRGNLHAVVLKSYCSLRHIEDKLTGVNARHATHVRPVR